MNLENPLEAAREVLTHHPLTHYDTRHLVAIIQGLMQHIKALDPYGRGVVSKSDDF